MCLIANKPLTETLKKLTGKLTVWKAFTVNHDYKNIRSRDGLTLRTRYVGSRLSARYRTLTYEPNKLYTAPDSKINQFGEVHAGLHVCLTKAEAESLITTNSAYYAIVELQVNLADLVAVGRFSDYHAGTHSDKQAVFTKLKITKKQYDAAIAEAAARLRITAPNYFPAKRPSRTTKNR